jgi:heptosyltransferase-3
MAQIIDYCETELNTKVIITAAPVQAEIDKINSILSFCKSNPINLSGELSLKQTAALNKKAKLFIGVDTAIMHMSAANDTPVFAFFGPSGTDHWGPWDNDMMQSTYTERNGFQIMGKHRVFAESRGCQPCGQDGCNGTKVSDCLMYLDIDTIKKNIKEMFSE